MLQLDEVVTHRQLTHECVLQLVELDGVGLGQLSVQDREELGLVPLQKLSATVAPS